MDDGRQSSRTASLGAQDNDQGPNSSFLDEGIQSLESLKGHGKSLSRHSIQ